MARPVLEGGKHIDRLAAGGAPRLPEEPMEKHPLRRTCLAEIVTLTVALIAAGTISSTARGQVSMNTCRYDVVGPRQGRHTFLDMSADSVVWPPNHIFRTISISATNQNGDSCNVTITDARQDEAIDDPGSGSTIPDAQSCNNAG